MIDMVNEILGWMFGDILRATLSLAGVLLVGIGIYNWWDGTPAACARHRREIEAQQIRRKVDDAQAARDGALHEARQRAQEHLRTSRDSAEDVQEAARLFTEDYLRIQHEWRETGGRDE